MHGSATNPRTDDRLMVAVPPGPGAERLVRLARRTAAAMNAPWFVVYVATGQALTDEERRQLASSLDLARALGAEVISTAGVELSETLLRLAREQSVTRIICGKPRDGACWRRWGLGHPIDRLIRQSGEIEVDLVPCDGPSERLGPVVRLPAGGWSQAAWTLLVLAVVTALGVVIERTLGYPSVPLIYLIALVLAPLFLSGLAVMLLAIGSALTWWFFYLPHQFSLRISRWEDGLMLALFFVTALVNGHLASRLRARERGGVEGERRARALYDLLRGLSESRDMETGGLDRAIAEVERIFRARAVLFRPDTSGGGGLVPHPGGHLDARTCDIAAAMKAWNTRLWTGWGVDGESEGHATSIPLVSGERVWGVLVIQLPKAESWSALQRELMESIAHLLATMMERAEVTRQAEAVHIATESQKMQRALVDNFSHEMQTPLAVLSSAVQNLRQQAPSAETQDMLHEASVAVLRLSRVVNEMVDLAQLDTGMLRPALEWCDVADFLQEWLEGQRDARSGRRIVLSVPEKAVYVRVDTRLLGTVLDNVLTNALRHAPADTAVEVEAFANGLQLSIQIADRGPGFPAREADRIFERFYRGATAAPGGVGLGLAIAKEFVELIGGNIAAAPRPGGGACFTITLPCTTRLPLADGAKA